MGIFRLWQPHSVEYMFVWNSLVACHTIQQLADNLKERVYRHYDAIVALNQLDPMLDIGFGSRYDPFWLALTMADLGISPMLPKAAKWFYVTHPRKARTVLGYQGRGDEMVKKVANDIRLKYGLSLDLDTLGPL